MGSEISRPAAGPTASQGPPSPISIPSLPLPLPPSSPSTQQISLYSSSSSSISIENEKWTTKLSPWKHRQKAQAPRFYFDDEEGKDDEEGDVREYRDPQPEQRSQGNRKSPTRISPPKKSYMAHQNGDISHQPQIWEEYFNFNRFSRPNVRTHPQSVATLPLIESTKNPTEIIETGDESKDSKRQNESIMMAILNKIINAMNESISTSDTALAVSALKNLIGCVDNSSGQLLFGEANGCRSIIQLVLSFIRNEEICLLSLQALCVLCYHANSGSVSYRNIAEFGKLNASSILRSVIQMHDKNDMINYWTFSGIRILTVHLDNCYKLVTSEVYQSIDDLLQNESFRESCRNLCSIDSDELNSTLVYQVWGSMINLSSNLIEIAHLGIGSTFALILDVWSDCPSNPSIALWSMMIIQNISLHENIPNHSHDCLIRLINGALVDFSSDMGIFKQILTTIEHLALHEEYVPYWHQYDISTGILNAMSLYELSPAILNKGCCALINISYFPNAITIRPFIDNIIPLMKTSCQSSAVSESLLGLLLNLSYNSVDVVDKMLTRGVSNQLFASLTFHSGVVYSDIACVYCLQIIQLMVSRCFIIGISQNPEDIFDLHVLASTLSKCIFSSVISSAILELALSTLSMLSAATPSFSYKFGTARGCYSLVRVFHVHAKNELLMEYWLHAVVHVTQACQLNKVTLNSLELPIKISSLFSSFPNNPILHSLGESFYAIFDTFNTMNSYHAKTGCSSVHLPSDITCDSVEDCLQTLNGNTGTNFDQDQYVLVFLKVAYLCQGNSSNQTILGENGICEKIIDILSKYQSSPEVCLSALHAICGMCRYGSDKMTSNLKNIAKFTEHSICELICDLPHTKIYPLTLGQRYLDWNLDVCYWVSLSVSYLANESNNMKLFNSGGYLRIYDIAKGLGEIFIENRKPSASVLLLKSLKQAWAAIINLTVNKLINQSLGEVGCCEHLAFLLLHVDITEDLVSFLLKALLNFLLCKNHRTVFIRVGICPRILQLARKYWHSDDISLYTCLCLQKLSSAHVLLNSYASVDDCCYFLTSMLTKSPQTEKSLEAAIFAIFRFADSKEYVRVFYKLDICSLICNILESHNLNSILRLCVKSLEQLLARGKQFLEINELFICFHGANNLRCLAKVLQFCLKNPDMSDSVRVIKCSLRLLHAMLSLTPFRNCLKNSDYKSLIVDLSTKFRQDNYILFYATTLLKGLWRDEFTRLIVPRLNDEQDDDIELVEDEGPKFSIAIEKVLSIEYLSNLSMPELLTLLPETILSSGEQTTNNIFKVIGKKCENDPVYRSILESSDIHHDLLTATHMFLYSASVCQNIIYVAYLVSRSTPEGSIKLHNWTSELLRLLVRAMEKFRTTPKLVLHGSRMIKNLSVNSSLSAKLGIAGACNELIEILELYSNKDNSIVNYSIWAVINLSLHTDNRRIFVECGCGPLSDLLTKYSKKEAMLSYILMAVQNFALDNTCRSKFYTLGISKQVISAIDSHQNHIDTVTYGCLALEKLALSLNNREQIGLQGGCKILLQSISLHQDNATIIQYGWRACCQVAKSLENVQLFLQNGISEMLITGIIYFSDEPLVLEEILNALCLMTRYNPEEEDEEDITIPQNVRRFSRSTSTNLRHSVRNSVERFTSPRDSRKRAFFRPSSRSPRNLSTFSGNFDTPRDSVKATSPRQTKYSLSRDSRDPRSSIPSGASISDSKLIIIKQTSQDIIFNDMLTKRVFGDLGICSHLMSILNTHYRDEGENIRIVSLSLQLISQLCNNDDRNKSEFIGFGCPRIVYSAVSIQLLIADVVYSGCQALGALTTGSKEISTQLTRLGLPKLLFRVAVYHSDDPQILASALDALRLHIESSPEQLIDSQLNHVNLKPSLTVKDTQNIFASGTWKGLVAIGTNNGDAEVIGALCELINTMIKDVFRQSGDEFLSKELFLELISLIHLCLDHFPTHFRVCYYSFNSLSEIFTRFPRYTEYYLDEHVKFLLSITQLVAIEIFQSTRNSIEREQEEMRQTVLYFKSAIQVLASLVVDTRTTTTLMTYGFDVLIFKISRNWVDPLILKCAMAALLKISRNSASVGYLQQSNLAHDLFAFFRECLDQGIVEEVCNFLTMIHNESNHFVRGFFGLEQLSLLGDLLRRYRENALIIDHVLSLLYWYIPFQRNGDWVFTYYTLFRELFHVLKAHVEESTIVKKICYVMNSLLALSLEDFATPVPCGETFHVLLNTYLEDSTTLVTFFETFNLIYTAYPSYFAEFLIALDVDFPQPTELLITVLSNIFNEVIYCDIENPYLISQVLQFTDHCVRSCQGSSVLTIIPTDDLMDIVSYPVWILRLMELHPRNIQIVFSSLCILLNLYSSVETPHHFDPSSHVGVLDLQDLVQAFRTCVENFPDHLAITEKFLQLIRSVLICCELYDLPLISYQFLESNKYFVEFILRSVPQHRNNWTSAISGFEALRLIHQKALVTDLHKSLPQLCTCVMNALQNSLNSPISPELISMTSAVIKYTVLLCEDEKFLFFFIENYLANFIPDILQKFIQVDLIVTSCCQIVQRMSTEDENSNEFLGSECCAPIAKLLRGFHHHAPTALLKVILTCTFELIKIETNLARFGKEDLTTSIVVLLDILSDDLDVTTTCLEMLYLLATLPDTTERLIDSSLDEILTNLLKTHRSSKNIPTLCLQLIESLIDKGHWIDVFSSPFCVSTVVDILLEHSYNQLLCETGLLYVSKLFDASNFIELSDSCCLCETVTYLLETSNSDSIRICTAGCRALLALIGGTQSEVKYLDNVNKICSLGNFELVLSYLYLYPMNPSIVEIGSSIIRALYSHVHDVDHLAVYEILSQAMFSCLESDSAALNYCHLVGAMLPDSSLPIEDWSTAAELLGEIISIHDLNSLIFSQCLILINILALKHRTYQSILGNSPGIVTVFQTLNSHLKEDCELPNVGIDLPLHLQISFNLLVNNNANIMLHGESFASSLPPLLKSFIAKCDAMQENAFIDSNLIILSTLLKALDYLSKLPFTPNFLIFLHDEQLIPCYLSLLCCPLPPSDGTVEKELLALLAISSQLLLPHLQDTFHLSILQSFDLASSLLRSLLHFTTLLPADDLTLLQFFDDVLRILTFLLQQNTTHHATSFPSPLFPSSIIVLALQVFERWNTSLELAWVVVGIIHMEGVASLRKVQEGSGSDQTVDCLHILVTCNLNLTRAHGEEARDVVNELVDLITQTRAISPCFSSSSPSSL